MFIDSSREAGNRTSWPFSEEFPFLYMDLRFSVTMTQIQAHRFGQTVTPYRNSISMAFSGAVCIPGPMLFNIGS